MVLLILLELFLHLVIRIDGSWEMWGVWLTLWRSLEFGLWDNWSFQSKYETLDTRMQDTRTAVSKRTTWLFWQQKSQTKTHIFMNNNMLVPTPLTWRIIPLLGSVVNNHGYRVRPLSWGLFPSKWPNFMAYKWGWSDHHLLPSLKLT